MSEKEIERSVIHQLENHFTFIPQVKGTHFSGKRLAIDYVIKPLQSDKWKNKDIVFGLEFKDISRLDHKADTTDFTKWMAQCVDYAHTYWDDLGYIHILTCPGISTSEFLRKAYIETVVPKMLGHLGIGELKKTDYYGWAVYLQYQHRMWSEKEGVACGIHWNLVRKFGSR